MAVTVSETGNPHSADEKRLKIVGPSHHIR